MSVILVDPRPGTETRAADCRHDAVEVLGTNRGTTFTRCRACGDVLIVQGARAWTLRR
jgi:hypothetical protein